LTARALWLAGLGLAMFVALAVCTGFILRSWPLARR